MIEWVHAFRLPVCLFAAGLALVSFRMSGMRPSWSAVLAMLLIACAMMLQNDWRDRAHDRKKGKTLALRHPRTFLALVIATWSIAVMVAILATREHGPVGYMLFGAIVVGLVYSETRTIPVVPILLVAIASASPALMAVLAGAE